MLVALAPTSMMLKPSSEDSTGMVGIRPGRATPLIRPTMKIPQVNRAPVLPSDSKASALPSLTQLAATTMEESFLVRMALTGSSSSRITSVVATISIWSSPAGSSSFILPSSPKKINLSSGSSGLAFKTASTIASGAFSPPMASIAIFLINNLFFYIGLD